MRVRVLRSFGNHEAGDVCDSVRKLENGRKIDSDMDQKAFAHWIECGWAEEIDDEDVVVTKRIGRPPRDKARTAPEVK